MQASFSFPACFSSAHHRPSRWRKNAPLERPTPADPYAAHIAEASQRFGIPAAWIRAVMRVESANDLRAVSPKGAIGLMQIMPETWAGLRVRHSLGKDPSIRATTSWRARRICAKCTIGTARPVFSPRIMRDPADMKNISPAVPCRQRHAPMWPRSSLSSAAVT